jgi:hypothetical protein
LCQKDGPGLKTATKYPVLHNESNLIVHARYEFLSDSGYFSAVNAQKGSFRDRRIFYDEK